MRRPPPRYRFSWIAQALTTNINCALLPGLSTWVCHSMSLLFLLVPANWVPVFKSLWRREVLVLYFGNIIVVLKISLLNIKNANQYPFIWNKQKNTNTNKRRFNRNGTNRKICKVLQLCMGVPNWTLHVGFLWKSDFQSHCFNYTLLFHSIRRHIRIK